MVCLDFYFIVVRNVWLVLVRCQSLYGEGREAPVKDGEETGVRRL